MAIPDYKELMLPVLSVAARLEEITKHFGL
jgi:hypothetical protein